MGKLKSANSQNDNKEKEIMKGEKSHGVTKSKKNNDAKRRKQNLQRQIETDTKDKTQMTPVDPIYQIGSYTTHINSSNANLYLESLISLHSKLGVTSFNSVVKEVDSKTLVFIHGNVGLTESEVTELKKSTNAIEICHINPKFSYLKGTILLKFANSNDASNVYSKNAELFISGQKYSVKYLNLKSEKTQMTPVDRIYQTRSYTTHINSSNANLYLESLRSLHSKLGVTSFNSVVNELDSKTLVFYHGKVALTESEVTEVKKSTNAIEICHISPKFHDLKGLLLLKFADSNDASNVYSKNAELFISGQKHSVNYLKPKKNLKKLGSQATDIETINPEITKMEEDEEEE